MANMRMLIRIVFAIFIAKGINSLGSVYDDFCGCCDCLKKKEYEEIEGDENNPAKELVNKDWYNAKKNKPVLKMFIKEENGVFKDNENKVSFKLEGNNNPKIAYLNGNDDPLKLSDKKYAFFEIKTIANNTGYLYCSDIESGKINEGIFTHMGYINISVIACDIENVMNMNSMFCHCYGLEKLDLQNFNTTGVTNMVEMFALCSNLTELNIQSFNTINVTDMSYMFSECSSLKELNIQSFNTSNVMNMEGMFSRCSGLENLKLNNFNTEKVTNMYCMFNNCGSLTEIDLKNFNTKNVAEMGCMFYNCEKLTKLEFGKNFNTTGVTNVEYMFRGCQSFPDEIRSNLNDVEGIINFFKEKNQ